MWRAAGGKRDSGMDAADWAERREKEAGASAPQAPGRRRVRIADWAERREKEAGASAPQAPGRRRVRILTCQARRAGGCHDRPTGQVVGLPRA